MRISFPYAPLGATATSASMAGSAVFLNNVGAPVATASLALNITGSAGATGSNAVITGSVGPRGDVGDPATDGLNIYLLQDTRATCGGCLPGYIPPNESNECPSGWELDPSLGCCYQFV